MRQDAYKFLQYLQGFMQYRLYLFVFLFTLRGRMLASLATKQRILAHNAGTVHEGANASRWAHGRVQLASLVIAQVGGAARFV